MMDAPLLNAAAQEGPPGCGAIAGGSRGTVRAGAAVLAAGGNAVDAALAAMLATPLGEPAMTSMGGGGFLLVRTPEGDSTVVDFFVDTPGLGSSPRRPASFVPVLVTYPGAVQTFHIGAGAAAVPGCIPGFLDAHRAFGRLPLAQVLAPAMAMAIDGWPWEFMQVRLLDLVRDIFNSAETGRTLVNRAEGQPVQVGDLARLPQYGRLLAGIAEGAITSLASPAFAEPMLSYMKLAGGLITEDDLVRYRVYHRAPITLHRHGADIMTNPSPSFGGPIIIDALAQTERLEDAPAHWCAAAHNLARSTEFQRQSALGPTVHSTQGTTHISVIDADGMVAALSTSNGAGSGAWVADLGLHLNNMLGEEDLNPAGFHAVPPGLRIGSMMAPTVVRREDGSLLAMGTGGSERIRSAIYQVLLRTVDLGASAAEAIVAPRFHPQGRTLQLEPGWPTAVLESFNLDHEINVWGGYETYFGGVHAVMRNADGSVQAVGDPRRHGTTAVVSPDGEILIPPLP